MPTIYAYEVEVRVRARGGDRLLRLATRQEHAYSVQDAVLQAVYAVMAEYGTDVDLAILRVGPLQVDILEQAKRLRDEVAAGTRAALDLRTALDVVGGTGGKASVETVRPCGHRHGRRADGRCFDCGERLEGTA